MIWCRALHHHLVPIISPTRLSGSSHLNLPQLFLLRRTSARSKFPYICDVASIRRLSKNLQFPPLILLKAFAATLPSFVPAKSCLPFPCIRMEDDGSFSRRHHDHTAGRAQTKDYMGMAWHDAPPNPDSCNKKLSQR